MPLSRHQPVTVRVWIPKKDEDVSLLDGDFGHISVEIGSDLNEANRRYISLWSKGSIESVKRESKIGTIIAAIRTPGLFSPVEYESYNLRDDMLEEGREPEYTQALYSLDIPKMIETYDKEIKNTTGWVLIGENILLNRGKAHSCSTLAYKILIAGGIKNLFNSGTVSAPNLSSITTPTRLMDAVKEAKRNELKKYPESRDFDTYENDTNNGASWISGIFASCNML